MIDDAGAAPAAAEPLTPGQDSGGAAAQPDAGAWQPESAPDRSKETARASIDRAFAAMEGDDGRDPQAAGKPPVAEKDDLRAAATLGEPPARFSADAKAAWTTVPDAVKGEVHRAMREMESGLGQYQQFFEPLKPFYQLAEAHQTTVQDALARYISLDFALLSQEPEEKLSAIQELIEHAGLSPAEYAALIAGQKPEATQAQSAAEIRQLKSELAEMRELLGGVKTGLQQSYHDKIDAMIVEFTKEHPRLNDSEFMKTVTRLISTQMADDLESAYDMAERLIPVSAAAARGNAASVAAIQPKPSDQTRKGQLSVAGAPVSGSNPVKRKPALSARESVDRAFADVGLGG